jgi:hypothetical protein
MRMNQLRYSDKQRIHSANSFDKVAILNRTLDGYDKRVRPKGTDVGWGGCVHMCTRRVQLNSDIIH